MARGYVFLGLALMCLARCRCDKPTQPPSSLFAETVPSPWDSTFNRLVERLDRGHPVDVSSMRGLGHAPQAIVAYPKPFSLAAGQPVTLVYSGDLLLRGSRLTRVVVHNAVTGEQVAVHAVDLPLQRLVCRTFARGGCGFPTEVTLAAPGRPGVYFVELFDDTGDASHPVYFNIRGTADSQGSAIVLMLPNHTWQAYNYFGGGSLYGILDPDKGGERYFPRDRLYAASLDRPLAASRERVYGYHSAEAAVGFLRVLSGVGLHVDTISNTDLHDNPGILQHAALLVIISHDEYWTEPMHRAIESFVKRGGNIANFSGNVGWWQVGLDERTLYKDEYYGSKPLPDHAPAALRNTRLGNMAGRAPERIFGVTYEYAGYPVRAQLDADAARQNGLSSEQYRDSDGVVITDAGHPVFAGTGLRNGEHWGAELVILAGELDGVPLDAERQPYPDVRARFPARLRVVARATSYNANQVVLGGKPHRGLTDIGVFVETRPFDGGGRVISFGSIGYAKAVYDDDPIAVRIFLNAVGYLLPGQGARK